MPNAINNNPPAGEIFALSDALGDEFKIGEKLASIISPNVC